MTSPTIPLYHLDPLITMPTPSALRLCLDCPFHPLPTPCLGCFYVPSWLIKVSCLPATPPTERTCFSLFCIPPGHFMQRQKYTNDLQVFSAQTRPSWWEVRPSVTPHWYSTGTTNMWMSPIQQNTEPTRWSRRGSLQSSISSSHPWEYSL